MIYTFKYNSTSTDNLKKEIEKFVEINNRNNDEKIVISKNQIYNLAIRLFNASYVHLANITASDEDRAREDLDEILEIDNFEDGIEITDIDDSDEMEAEERARAKYEAQLEDEAMERYYEEKYGDKE